MYGGATDDLAHHPAAAAPPDEITRRHTPIQLADTELDRVVAAGSKPGMVGDGRAPLSFLTMR